MKLQQKITFFSAFKECLNHADKCHACYTPIIDSNYNPGSLDDACTAGRKLLLRYMAVESELMEIITKETPHGASNKPIRLSPKDWSEIYYALDYKTTSPAVRDDTRWRNHILRIMKRIGPDGEIAEKYGVDNKLKSDNSPREFTIKQRNMIVDLLWESLKRDPDHRDRKQTGWGTKTIIGLIACLERIAYKE